jgi:hypothetical protein
VICGNEPVSSAGSGQSSGAWGGAMIAVALSACWLVTFLAWSVWSPIDRPVRAAPGRRRCVRRVVDLYVTCAGIGSIRPYRRRVAHWGTTKAPGVAVIATEAAAAAKSDVLQLIVIRAVTLSSSDVVCESIARRFHGATMLSQRLARIETAIAGIY